MTIIQVQKCQADNIAVHQLDAKHPVVSDPCVVREILALAAERDIDIQFCDSNKKPLDLAGVRRVLEEGVS